MREAWAQGSGLAAVGDPAMDCRTHRNGEPDQRVSMRTAAWMDMARWEACTDSALKEENFLGKECVAAIVMASKFDLMAKVKIFREEDDYFAFGRYYVNEVFARSEDDERFKAWAREGWIRITPGVTVGSAALRDELIGSKDGTVKGDRERFDLLEVAFIPDQLQESEAELLEWRVPVIYLQPSTDTFAPVMKLLEKLVQSRHLHHAADPVLGWGVASVICNYDDHYFFNIRNIRRQESGRIDPAVALILAFARMHARGAAERGLLVV
jgi:phage terminase large subunit-like protein